jgi:hypothetical protein
VQHAVPTPPSRRGRPVTEITDEQRALLNEFLCVVFYPAHGVALVHDRLAAARFRFTQFEKRYGAVGRLWLAWAGRRVCYSDFGYAQAAEDMPPVSAEAEAFAAEIARVGGTSTPLELSVTLDANKRKGGAR